MGTIKVPVTEIVRPREMRALVLLLLGEVPPYLAKYFYPRATSLAEVAELLGLSLEKLERFMAGEVESYYECPFCGYTDDPCSCYVEEEWDGPILPGEEPIDD